MTLFGVYPGVIMDSIMSLTRPSFRLEVDNDPRLIVACEHGIWYFRTEIILRTYHLEFVRSALTFGRWIELEFSVHQKLAVCCPNGKGCDCLMLCSTGCFQVPWIFHTPWSTDHASRGMPGTDFHFAEDKVCYQKSLPFFIRSVWYIVLFLFSGYSFVFFFFNWWPTYDAKGVEKTTCGKPWVNLVPESVTKLPLTITIFFMTA
jgi:hypothetical protein